MTEQAVSLRAVQLSVFRAVVLLVLASGLSGCAPATVRQAPSNVATTSTREQFLEMWARAYFPGRTGQLLIVPREGEFITRPDPNYKYMHGSPWPYDVAIPVMFAGPAVKSGVYAGAASQQDVAPTVAAALALRMPPTATGRVLPVLREHFTSPRAAIVIVADGMRRDYFDRYAALMPTFTALRQRSAWFANAQVNVLPSNTAVGHSTVSTGADPSVHGVTGVTMYDFKNGKRQDLFSGLTPQDLMALTLADVLQFATAGRAVILVQGSIDRAATPLAGHGACQINGSAVVLASYDQEDGHWKTNTACFRLPDYLKERDAKAIWIATPEWMGHRIDSPVAVRYTSLFPVFEVDAMSAMIDREGVGADDVPDLILMNYKGADFVGHKYGPDSEELRATLAEMDRQLARLLATLEARVGDDYLLAVTADHGMPAEPRASAERRFAPDIVELLHQRFDPQAKRLVVSFEPENSQMYVDERRLAELGLTLRDLKVFLESQPSIFAVFTNDEVARAYANVSDRTDLLSSTSPAGSRRRFW